MAGSLLKKVLIAFFIILNLLTTKNLFSQNKVLKGTIKDAHSEELIPFASMKFKNGTAGRLSDSAGAFTFRFQEWPTDTLVITYVGYEDYFLVFDSILLSRVKNNVLDISIHLVRGKFTNEVVVKKKIDRGLLMWRRIVKKKPLNDRYRFENFSYELYNKLEIDLKNVKREKWQKYPIIKNFGFVFDNVDTTEEGRPFLPVYLTEAISDYYYQKDPKRRREIIKGTKTLGVSNESVLQFLGGMDQNVNFYSNFIPVFDKLFISPLSDNGDNYYRYKVLDSQFVNNRRLIHMSFTPKRVGENTFEGDCWVHDTTWAVQKMNLRLSKEANINYVDKLSLIQEFKLMPDGTWFLSRDKFVVDLSLTGEKTLSVIGRKTTTYENIVFNDSSVVNELAKNNLIEETIVTENAKHTPDSFWVEARHEPLTVSEQKIYKTIDTLLSLPSFQKTTKLLNFLATGYLNTGNYQIGPWQNWIYANVYEGMRLRWDLGTNSGFNKRLNLHGYVAYGFKDKQFKGKLEALYILKRSPRTSLYASYSKDFDRAQTYYAEISQDNIFALAIRKTGVPIKFLMMEEGKASIYKQWKNGFSVTLGADRKIYNPVMNLPEKSLFSVKSGEALNTFETSIQVRFAYLEKYLENTFFRTSLGSPYPISEIKLTKGMSGVLNSAYNYTKISGSVSDYMKIPPLGSIYYNVFAGKTYGTLPYMFLDVAPGNEIYYYNKYAFSLMNRFEFLHDQYAGINFEHNIGNGLFRYIPLTRKLKFRQFWNTKLLWGSLSDANKALNMPANSAYKFSTLDGKTYMEIGTGVDNIFKVFRMDLVWRVFPRPLPVEKVSRFGVFFSFRLAF